MSGKKDFYLSSYWLKIDRPTTQRGGRKFDEQEISYTRHFRMNMLLQKK